MKTYSIRFVVQFFILFLMIPFCAGAQQKPAVAPGGEMTVTMVAKNFTFVPNSIQAHQGDILTLNIENTSGGDHNFTLKTPRGDTVVNKDLPAKSTTPIKITLSESGTYTFHCGKPFHSMIGMKGRIEVAAP